MIFCYQIILSYYLKIIKRKYNILQISVINKTRSDTESPVSERIFIIFASGVPCLSRQRPVYRAGPLLRARDAGVGRCGSSWQYSAANFRRMVRREFVRWHTVLGATLAYPIRVSITARWSRSRLSRAPSRRARRTPARTVSRRG